MIDVKEVTYTGTGATHNINIGFIPSRVEIYNKVIGLVAFWSNTDPTYTYITHPYVDGILDDPVPQIGSTKANVANVLFRYKIAGVEYQKAAVSAGTAPGNDVVPQGKWGAVAFDIAADGTLDAVEASNNATGYTTEALAIAGIPAAGTSHIRAFYVTATKSDGNLTFGTTALDASGVTCNFYSYNPRQVASAITEYGDALGDSYYGVTLSSSDYINKAGEAYILKAYR